MEKEKEIMRIRNNHIRGIHLMMCQYNDDEFIALRKLTRRREVVDGSLKRRDIIEDYNNHASQVLCTINYKHYTLNIV